MVVHILLCHNSEINSCSGQTKSVESTDIYVSGAPRFQYALVCFLADTRIGTFGSRAVVSVGRVFRLYSDRKRTFRFALRLDFRLRVNVHPF